MAKSGNFETIFGLVHPTEWSSILRVEWQSGQRQHSACERVIHKSRTLTHAPWCYIWEMWDATILYSAQKRPLDTLFYQKRFQTEVTGDNNRQTSFCRFEAQCWALCSLTGEETLLQSYEGKKVPPHIHLQLFSTRSSEMCGEKKWGKEGPSMSFLCYIAS